VRSARRDWGGKGVMGGSFGLRYGGGLGEVR